MDDKYDGVMDRALAALAQEVEAGSPRPGPDLVARVLADAADLAPEPPRPARPVGGGGSVLRVREVLLGWTSGAVATLSLCLALGIGVGLAVDMSGLPWLGDEADAAEQALMGDGVALGEGFL